MREILDAGERIAAMDRERARLLAGGAAAGLPAPLEAIREIAPAERRVLDLTGSAQTPSAIAEHVPDALVDSDLEREHDVALLGTALSLAPAPSSVLERARGSLVPGGRVIVLLSNRRSLFVIAGLAKNRPFVLPGAWPETGPGATTLAELNMLFDFARFTDSTICARVGEAIPASVVFPVQIAFDAVSINVHTPEDLRDLLTIAYVVAARTPLTG